MKSGALAIIALALIVFLCWKVEEARDRDCETVWVGKTIIKPEC